MSSITFHARDVVFKYATGVTIDTSSDLATAFTNASGVLVGVLKDVTISPPEGDVNKEDFLGEDGNGFQNARMNENSFSEAEISGTMAIDSGEVFETLAYGSGEQIATNAYTRYQAGNGGRVTNGGILVSLDNGTNQVNIVLNNLYFTKLGDIKPTGTDGHWEMEFTAKCLPKDYFEEWKN